MNNCALFPPALPEEIRNDRKRRAEVAVYDALASQLKDPNFHVFYSKEPPWEVENGVWLWSKAKDFESLSETDVPITASTMKPACWLILVKWWRANSAVTSRKLSWVRQIISTSCPALIMGICLLNMQNKLRLRNMPGIASAGRRYDIGNDIAMNADWNDGERPKEWVRRLGEWRYRRPPNCRVRLVVGGLRR